MNLVDFLKCSRCQLEFDNELRSCKLLSCSCSMCFSCIKEMCDRDENVTYECVKCKRRQSVYDLKGNELVTSQIVTYLIENRAQIILKDFSCILTLTLKEKKRQLLKQHEGLVKKIDHHAQQLIEVNTKPRFLNFNF